MNNFVSLCSCTETASWAHSYYGQSLRFPASSNRDNFKILAHKEYSFFPKICEVLKRANPNLSPPLLKMTAQSDRYNAFLSYLSRVDGVVVYPDVRDKVAVIHDRMKAKNPELNFFLTASPIGPILPQLIDGLDNSRCYVIFLTANYMNHVNTPGSQVQQEFLYALDEFGLARCILVSLEEEMLNRTNWRQIFKFRLGAFAAIDMSSEELMDENIDLLIQQIERIQ